MGSNGSRKKHSWYLVLDANFIHALSLPVNLEEWKSYWEHVKQVLQFSLFLACTFLHELCERHLEKQGCIQRVHGSKSSRLQDWASTVLTVAKGFAALNWFGEIQTVLLPVPLYLCQPGAKHQNHLCLSFLIYKV